LCSLVPEVDARARSGCSCQKWMLVPEVDARARSGCSCQNVDAMREQGLRNLPKGDDYQRMDWPRRLYSLGDPYLE
jgi:hypothetical protein